MQFPGHQPCATVQPGLPRPGYHYICGECQERYKSPATLIFVIDTQCCVCGLWRAGCQSFFAPYDILHYAAEEYDYTPTDAPPELELVEVAV